MPCNIVWHIHFIGRDKFCSGKNSAIACHTYGSYSPEPNITETRYHKAGAEVSTSGYLTRPDVGRWCEHSLARIPLLITRKGEYIIGLERIVRVGAWAGKSTSDWPREAYRYSHLEWMGLGLSLRFSTSTPIHYGPSRFAPQLRW